MQRVNNLEQFDFNSVPVDMFWDEGDEKELKIHRIHAYPAKFPAFITTKALAYVEANFGNKKDFNTIGDIFCGCGTTAFESKRNGKNFWGCDINPVATLIARTKSYKYDLGRIDYYYQRIVEGFRESAIENLYLSANDRLKYWYNETQYNELAHLKTCIENCLFNDPEYLDFFYCAFSNILKPTSMWLTKSIKPQFDPTKYPAEVFLSYTQQIRKMKNAFQEAEISGEPSSTIFTGDFLSNIENIPKIDLLITSPPYVTSYEYADLHQLSSLWLGYADDYRDLRKGSIGSLSHREISKESYEKLNKTGKAIVDKLQMNCVEKVSSVTRYFLDMQNVTEKVSSLLSENGAAVFVIGNTEYKGARIDNAKHLSEAMIFAGFNDLYITKRRIRRKILTPYRNKKGHFSSNSNGRQVYSEEFLILGRKA